ncbi:MAG: MurT ligase domain-containing protein [Bacilli bacterium]|jgi:UDP-N-acetylmuramyl tripeptide synthase
MRKVIAIILGKIAKQVLKRRDGGSAYPGALAKKICPDILEVLIRPKLIVAVTATNGKTSTATIITNMLSQNGYTVGFNSSGTNTDNGVITLLIDSCNLKGQVVKDALVLEVDERHTKEVFKHLQPDYLIIGNITRDQAPRNGHLDVVMTAMKQALNDNMHLIVNGDDPLINKLTLNHKGKITYYGVSKNEASYVKARVTNLDIAYCPKCHARLEFKYFHYSNTGDYLCPNGDFKRPKIDYEATKINYRYKHFYINDQIKLPMQNDILFHIYNTLAAFTLSQLIGLKPEDVIASLKNLSFSIIRFEKLKLDNRPCTVLSCKNETPNSYDQSLLYIKRHREKKTVVMGFNRVCSRYTWSDLGWLWDADFEVLKDSNIDKIVCVGKFAYDVATRLIYAGINTDDIIICQTLDQAIKIIRKKTKGPIYAALNFDIVRQFATEVKEVTL